MNGLTLAINPAVTDLPQVEEVLSWLPEYRSASLPGRWLVLADIHANWHALAAVLRHARGRYQGIQFQGDLVGYGPRPVECVDLFKRARLEEWSPGNHDLGVVGQLTRHTAGAGTRVGADAKTTWETHRAALGEFPSIWKWFDEVVSGACVDPVHLLHRECFVTRVHGMPKDPLNHYVFPSDWANTLENLTVVGNAWTKLQGNPENATWAGHRNGRDSTPGYLLAGHTHMPVLMQIEPGQSRLRVLEIPIGQAVSVDRGAFLINPGSVGQPRDGDPRAAYAILDVNKSTIEFDRTAYDVQAVVNELVEKKYPPELSTILHSGRIPRTEADYESVYERREGRLVPR